MSETNQISSAVDFSKNKYSLKAKIRLAMQQANSPSGKNVLRIEENISEVDPLKWLHRQTDSMRIYWSERDSHFEMAGIGSVDIISSDSPESYDFAFTKMRSVLKDGHSGLRYYGGFCFDQNSSTDSVWKDFGIYWFVIPKLEIIRKNGNTILALNIRFDPLPKSLDDMVEKAVARIEYEPDYELEDDPKMLSRSDVPDQTDWFQNVEKAMAKFGEGELKKIVLSRRSVFNFSRPIDATHIMANLKTLSADAFRFCIQPAKDVAFIGVSPELLYRRKANQIFSEAVAGTRPRGENEVTDKKLAKDLIDSPKDVREHSLVCEWIEQAMMRLCDSYDSDKRIRILKTNRVQHLYKRYRGVLNEGDDAGILSLLHPTPAVAGTPQENSLHGIREIETFKRGWYAGPVGWVGSDSAEFAVGIRSGLIHQNRLYLFSGAGILPDSDAEQEWQELEHKISHYLKFFRTNAN